MTAAPTLTNTAPDVDITSSQRHRRTLTFQLEQGPLVVEDWQPLEPADVPPILLIHGWGGTGGYWRQTAFRLSQTARVIVPDLPGTGRSQPVTSAQDMFDQVNTLAHLLDLLEIDKVQLNGHSMGGAMALLLAQKRPEQIERMVLTCLSFFATKSDEQIYKVAMSFFRLTMGLRTHWLAWVPGMTQLMATRYFYHVPDNGPLLRQGLMDFLTLDAGTAMACADNAYDPSITQAGAAVTVPVLLVACDKDLVMPVKNIPFTAETIPNCELRWIKDCGHLPMVEREDEYMGLMGEFLQL